MNDADRFDRLYRLLSAPPEGLPRQRVVSRLGRIRACELIEAAVAAGHLTETPERVGKRGPMRRMLRLTSSGAAVLFAAPGDGYHAPELLR